MKPHRQGAIQSLGPVCYPQLSLRGPFAGLPLNLKPVLEVVIEVPCRTLQFAFLPRGSGRHTRFVPTEQDGVLAWPEPHLASPREPGEPGVRGRRQMASNPVTSLPPDQASQPEGCVSSGRRRCGLRPEENTVAQSKATRAHTSVSEFVSISAQELQQQAGRAGHTVVAWSLSADSAEVATSV